MGYSGSSSRMASKISSSSSPRKGDWPSNISYVKTPKAHQSTALPYLCSSRIYESISQHRVRLNRTISYLRGHELGSATECACRRTVPHLLLAQTIICDSDMSVKGEQYVVQFQIPASESALQKRHNTEVIPIDDTVGVEVLQGQKNLACVELSLSQRELFSLDVKH